LAIDPAFRDAIDIVEPSERVRGRDQPPFGIG